MSQGFRSENMSGTRNYLIPWRNKAKRIYE